MYFFFSMYVYKLLAVLTFHLSLYDTITMYTGLTSLTSWVSYFFFIDILTIAKELYL